MEDEEDKQLSPSLAIGVSRIRQALLEGNKNPLDLCEPSSQASRSGYSVLAVSVTAA